MENRRVSNSRTIKIAIVATIKYNFFVIETFLNCHIGKKLYACLFFFFYNKNQLRLVKSIANKIDLVKKNENNLEFQ